MIAVVVPAHNEQAHLGACMASLKAASQHWRLNQEPVMLVVVLDACNDASELVARAAGATCVQVDARNVGVARAVGAQLALDAGARWLSFTDADSVVAPDWLVAQLALGCDAVCGTVAVNDWGAYGDHMQRHYAATYCDADGHSHVHGANLGISAQAYMRVGGFSPLCCHEDVALVEALRRDGARIAWSAAPRVVTSARKAFRAPAGFGATLARLDKQSQHTDPQPLDGVAA
ncbi:MAG: glycosyltransferase [Burkholderiales bacterium]